MVDLIERFLLLNDELLAAHEFPVSEQFPTLHYTVILSYLSVLGTRYLPPVFVHDGRRRCAIMIETFAITSVGLLVSRGRAGSSRM